MDSDGVGLGSSDWRGLSPELVDALFDTALGILGIATFDGRLEWVNRAYVEAFGYSRDELLSLDYVSMVHPEDLHEVAALLEQMSDGLHGHPIEIRVQHKDGSWRWFRSRTRVVGDRVVLSGVDVTDERAALAAQLEESERLGSFAALAAHDLQSPLTSASGAIDSLALRLDTDPYGLLSMASRNLSRMDTIVKSFLALSQAGVGTVPVTETDLGEITDAAVAAVSAHAAGVGATIVSHGDMPVVLVDAGLATAALTNLLANAIRHGSNGGDKVTIEIGVEHRNDAEVTVVVADDGPGVSVEERERIFEWSERGSTPASGFGLGLALARRVVAAHGGTLWWEPNNPRGSRFCFTVPLVRSA